MHVHMLECKQWYPVVTCMNYLQVCVVDGQQIGIITQYVQNTCSITSNTCTTPQAHIEAHDYQYFRVCKEHLLGWWRPALGHTEWSSSQRRPWPVATEPLAPSWLALADTSPITGHRRSALRVDTASTVLLHWTTNVAGQCWLCRVFITIHMLFPQIWVQEGRFQYLQAIFRAVECRMEFLGLGKISLWQKQ